MSDTRQRLHELIDQLAPEQFDAVAGVLKAALKREEISAEEERAVDEAKQWLRDNGGKGIPHEEVLAEFGLTLDDSGKIGEQPAHRRTG